MLFGRGTIVGERVGVDVDSLSDDWNSISFIEYGITDRSEVCDMWDKYIEFSGSVTKFSWIYFNWIHVSLLLIDYVDFIVF